MSTLKNYIINKLLQENCFWSYDNVSVKEISDEILIEKTLLYLDIDDIDKLFLIYPYQVIKKVWLNRLIPQEDYLHSLNRFYAWYYFNAKSPDAYIKAMATRYFNNNLS